MTTGALSTAIPCHDAPPRPEPRVPVVIAIEPDGFLRVFAPAHVDIRFIGVLDTSPESRTDAEHYAVLQLPRSHRAVAFDARCSRGVYMPSRVTVEDEQERMIARSLLRECRR
jgi:hypothetical protein